MLIFTRILQHLGTPQVHRGTAGSPLYVDFYNYFATYRNPPGVSPDSLQNPPHKPLQNPPQKPSGQQNYARNYARHMRGHMRAVHFCRPSVWENLVRRGSHQFLGVMGWGLGGIGKCSHRRRRRRRRHDWAHLGPGLGPAWVPHIMLYNTSGRSGPVGPIWGWAWVRHSPALPAHNGVMRTVRRE